MQLSSLPIRKLSRVYHVGTFNPALKGAAGPSLEGSGLSVSLHPDEWRRIARLDGSVFALTKETGQFLDNHKLSSADRRQLEDWGISRGWCRLCPHWKLTWTDLESADKCFSLFSDEASAALELEDRQDGDPDATLEPVQVPLFTEAAERRLGFSLSAVVVPDLLATFYVEDHTSLDGVWWNDKLDPFSYSAPRGVILPSRLHSWTRTLVGA